MPLRIFWSVTMFRRKKYAPPNLLVCDSVQTEGICPSESFGLWLCAYGSNMSLPVSWPVTLQREAICPRNFLGCGSVQTEEI
jgi:hypothetical protein